MAVVASLVEMKDGEDGLVIWSLDVVVGARNCQRRRLFQMCSIIGEQGDEYKELHALRPCRAM